MSEKIKAMRGSEKRSEEVKEWLKSQGAIDAHDYEWQNEQCLYFVNKDNTVDYISVKFTQLVDIVELPEKPAVNFKPYDKVLVRDTESDNWICDSYSHYNEHTNRYVCTGGVPWHMCIPYEGNEHLVGRVN